MDIAAMLLLQLPVMILGCVISNPKGGSMTDFYSGRPNLFIVGGEIVQGRQYPGQVSLQYYGGHNCGGSILNENYILTAAHCSQYKPFDLNVLSGTNYLDNGGTQHNVLEIHVHENYNADDSWHNDIAVIKIPILKMRITDYSFTTSVPVTQQSQITDIPCKNVTPPFLLDNDTAPVALPVKGQSTPVGSKATVIGWGRLSHGGEISNELRKVDIMISDHDQCNKTYNGDGLNVYPEQICADTPEGNKGSCQGDSGGPLLVNGQVVGVVSWTKGCAEKGYPSVYTEVADYIEWIQSKINT